MRTAVIIANGEMPSAPEVRRILRKASTLVCADGGALHALRMGFQPDVVIGDLDSLPARCQPRLKKAKIIGSTDQNSTDLEKALLHLIKKKVKRITIIGGTGKRIDQTMANISLLEKYGASAQLTLLDPTGTIELIDSKLRFRATPGERISLLPVGKVSGVTTSGLRYPLKNGRLEPGSRGISNEATSRSVEIRVRRGKLLLVRLFAEKI